MILLVGLGNPGPKYARNRHNIGFMALDQIADDHGFGPWRGRFQGSLTEGRLGDDKALLLKPETFMNLSGQSVGEAMRFYKLTPEDIWVVHDEIDLPPGKVKLKRGGGHAGHNGLRSVHQHIGPEYGRVRIGVGHPGRKEAVPGYVLHDFAKADEAWIDDVLRGLSDGAPDLARGDAARASNAIALRVAPPRPSTGQKKPKAAPEAAVKETEGESRKNAPEPPADTRSPLEKLLDRFK